MANLSRLFSVKIGRQTTAAQYGVLFKNNEYLRRICEEMEEKKAE
ncbi:hypothetical protein [Salmonella enterica]|nr:hypothetical protein [Salmonella enterica]